MSLNGIDFGLLKFCLQHSDAPNLKETELPNRDPKDYEWLRAALNNLEDDSSRMKKLLKVVQGETKSEIKATLGEKSDENVTESEAEKTETRRFSLEELQYYVEDLDNATTFAKIGGIPVILEYLSASEPPSIQYWAMWILASLLQNHPSLQSECLKAGALKIVLETLEKAEDSVKEKALYALSGFVKDNPPALEQFIQSDGIRLVSYFITKFQSPKSFIKSIFFLTQVLQNSPSHRPLVLESVHKLDLIQHILPLINHEDVDTREKAEEFLLEFLQGFHEASEKEKIIAPVKGRMKVILGLGEQEISNHQEELSTLKAILVLLK